ncbi:hypothetical protein [Lysobacter gummosus]|uniref:hypothetical protein n=1 Tax=Lysobacter gummosus TaxID=262324 RepID=UPI003631195D
MGVDPDHPGGRRHRLHLVRDDAVPGLALSPAKGYEKARRSRAFSLRRREVFCRRAFRPDAFGSGRGDLKEKHRA